MPQTFGKQKTQFMGINLTSMNKDAIDEQAEFTVKDLSKWKFSKMILLTEI